VIGGLTGGQRFKYIVFYCFQRCKEEGYSLGFMEVLKKLKVGFVLWSTSPVRKLTLEMLIYCVQLDTGIDFGTLRS
jgi:hypothetical protein